ncbi:MAG: ShlB/FhaC/HecB family hemolysin secretion/activation protein [Desulfovibrio sp.]|uniref:ShlB/FhaC/HecB family hemolysin secretion/activation protein n=1 Tax=Desulfovibrio sp. TaxID=885 RepID=UPI0039E6C631
MKKICLYLLALFIIFQGFAEAATRDGAQFRPEQNTELFDQKLRQLEEQQRSSLFTLPPEQKAKQPEQPQDAGAQCILIEKISVSGVTLLSNSKLKSIIAHYEGKCLTLGDINTILQEITNAYTEEGLVSSRAVLEPQDLSSGTLHIKVVEGRVESIEMSPKSTMASKQLLSVFPFVKGSVLNLRDIEQGLDQMNRLPSNRATMSIAPGTQLGSSKVIIDNIQERTWRPSVGFDNLGQDNTGRSQYTLGLEKDNLIGCNDQVSLYYTGVAPEFLNQTDNDREGFSESVTGLFSIPFGYWLLSGSASRFNYSTQVYGLNQAYTSNGSTSALRVALDRVVWRDNNSKLSLGTFIQYRDVVNRFEGVRLTSSSYRLTTSGLVASYVRRMLGGVLTMQAEQIWGLPTMSWSVPGPESSTTPHTAFSKTTGNLGWYRPFQIGEQQWSLNLSAYGQTSEQTMYGSERLYLGSPYTVRGFRETPVGGDCGGYTRSELAWTVPEKWLEPVGRSQLGPVQIFGAYDYGGITRDSKDPYEWGELQGVALGVRTSGPLAIQATWSTPLSAPSYVKDRDSVWYLTVRYTF